MKVSEIAKRISNLQEELETLKDMRVIESDNRFREVALNDACVLMAQAIKNLQDCEVDIDVWGEKKS